MVAFSFAHHVIKILLTLFVAILVPVYWHNYGPQNFLWLSDIGLFLTVIALWLTSPLLISIATVAIFPVEIAWNVDFFVQLITGRNMLHLAHYMFEAKHSLLLKTLSLFHVAMPVIWLWYLLQWSYDRRAFKYSLMLAWVVLPLTYWFTDPQQNINWVFSPVYYRWYWPSSAVWLIMLMGGFPLLFFLPMHILLLKVAKIN